jgi:hypothetical protein
MNKLSFLICILLIGLCVKAEEPAVKTIIINNEYLSSLSAKPVIARDQFVQQSVNTLIQARGKILSIDKNGKYNRQYRLKVKDSTSIKQGMDIVYYIYLNKDETFKMLAVNMSYEFNGQVLFTTPLNSARTSYAYSILLGEGAILIDSEE